MNENVIEFYRKVRADKGLQDALSEGKTVDQFAEIAVAKAEKIGLELEKADVIAALGDISNVVTVAANDDELADFELELIAAGVPPECASTEA